MDEKQIQGLIDLRHYLNAVDSSPDTGWTCSYETFM